MNAYQHDFTLLPPKNGWVEHIESIYSGRWLHPETRTYAPHSGIRVIDIADTLVGKEVELIRACGLKGVDGNVALVADENTWDAAGGRIAHALRSDGIKLIEVILKKSTKATSSAVDALQHQLIDVQTAIAVGSGTVNDLVKYVTAQDKRDYCVFGTAASMDGYTSKTASITFPNGLKRSVPAHMPKGVFFDIDVIASAPPFLASAGFGDCLCNSVARIDWWMSHRLLGTRFYFEPYLIAESESEVFSKIVPGIVSGDAVAIGYLVRSLVLSGLGVAFSGTSHHGSMGEHQISHYIDCFARERHPGSLHGAQVGLASLTMSRIQQWFLSQSSPPQLRPTNIDIKDMQRRMGSEIAYQCLQEYRVKSLDVQGAERLNQRLAEIWSELQVECQEIVQTTESMTQALALAGGATTATELGLSIDFYREAVQHGHEMRNRFSFADLACDSGLLESFAMAEC